MRTDAHGIDAEVDRGGEVALDRAETGDDEDAELRAAKMGARDLQHRDIRHQALAELERRGGEPVAMSDLDDRDARGLGGGAVRGDLRRVELVHHGVVAVTQRGIADQDVLHRQLSPRPANLSAAAIAAQLMMSRFPA